MGGKRIGKTSLYIFPSGVEEHHADNRNAIAKRLKWRDSSTPNEHGNHDQQYALQYATQMKNQTGRLTKLHVEISSGHAQVCKDRYLLVERSTH